MEKRTPKNMQDLLKFAIKQQQNDRTDCIEIDEEKKKFLNSVLQSMSVNVMEEFLNAIKILQNELSSDVEKCEALDLIRNYIDNIDFANSFVKMEGADILINCLKNANKSVCTETINIVAEMCQNNPFCQQYFLEKNIVELLIVYLNNEDSEIVASSLYALSSLTRSFEPALMEFVRKDGIRNVNNCLNSESHRVFLKSCFLITSMSTEFALLKDECAKLGVLNKLLKKLHAVNNYEVEIEMILKTMSVLLESLYCTINEDERKNVVQILQNIVVKNEKLPECEEIVSHSKSILRYLE